MEMGKEVQRCSELDAWKRWVPDRNTVHDCISGQEGVLELMDSQPSSHGDVFDKTGMWSPKYRPILMIHILISYKNKPQINTLGFLA